MFALLVKMIKSLAFVPPNEIEEYFTCLERKFNDDDIKKIGCWFKKNYIGDETSQPRYEPHFWSVYDTTGRNSETFPRTQNNVEAWHRRLKCVVGKSHAGVYKLLAHLKDEMIYAKVQLERIQNGEHIAKKRKTIKKNKQIRRVIKKRTRLSNTSYLKRIAANLML